MNHLTKHNGESFYCYRCLHRFISNSLFKKHVIVCREHPAQVIKMPEAVDSFLHFKGTHMQHPIQYTIYADFESLILPISTLSSHHSYNMKVSQHVPWGYANLIIELDRKPLKIIQCYRGKNAVKHFLDALITEKELLITFLSSSLSSQCDYSRMKKEFMKQLQCHIC